jgi:hypothetical protein
MSTTEKNKRLVRRYIEEVVNTGNVDDLARCISLHYLETHDTSGQSSGLQGARRHLLGVRQTHPDLHVTIEQRFGGAYRAYMGRTGRFFPRWKASA